MKTTFAKPCGQLVQSEGHEVCDVMDAMNVIHEVQVEIFI